MPDALALPRYADRVAQALALLCDEPPPMDLVQQWLDGDESWVETDADNLQDWAANHSRLDWFMGITVIEAAIAMARQPNENLIGRIGLDAHNRGKVLASFWWR